MKYIKKLGHRYAQRRYVLKKIAENIRSVGSMYSKNLVGTIYTDIYSSTSNLEKITKGKIKKYRSLLKQVKTYNTGNIKLLKFKKLFPEAHENYLKVKKRTTRYKLLKQHNVKNYNQLFAEFVKGTSEKIWYENNYDNVIEHNRQRAEMKIGERRVGDYTGKAKLAEIAWNKILRERDKDWKF